MTTTETTAAPAAMRLTVGKKVVVAVTGILGLGFVFAHMLGNLKAFLGPRQVNEYGEFLRDMGHPIFPRSMLLWILRLSLIVAVVLHVYLTAQLALRSRAARPVRYAKTRRVDSAAAARTMRWGGVALLLFIVFHLADFTWGVHPDYVRGDTYANLVSGFSRWWAVALYLLAMFALAMHVYHGVWSVTQTLGVKSRFTDARIRAFAAAFAVILFVGFSAAPLGVAFDVIK